MAEEMGYDSIVNFSASINPYYSLWRKEIKLLLDGVVSNGQGAKKDELFVSQFHFDSKLNALFDLDEKIYRVLSNPKLIEFKKYVFSKELDFLTEQQHLMKLILSQLVRIVEESLVTCKNLHSEANTRSEYPVSFGLGPFLLDLGKCGESTLNPQNLQSPSTSFTDGQSDAADFEEGREVCSTGRVPHLDVFERAYISMHGNELSDEISLIVSYADVLRRRVTSALDSLNALQLRVLADAENETTNLEVEKSASESLGSLILGTSDPVHQSSKQDKVNKTLMVLDMLTMHNFRKLPSVAQLRTLEYEASSILKDKSDPRIEVGETPSKLDSMMEAFVRQCWRKRTHVIVLNANPILLQFCADSLLGNLGAYGGQNADCRTEVEKAQHRFCLTPRQSVALGVLAILFRYQSNMDKIETDKLKQMLLLVISPSSASTGLDLIRGFACCQCLARTNDAHSSFGSEVLEFALNHISSPSITWGLAAEICGCFAAFCQTQTFSELGVVTSRFREISCATVRILDYLGAPANTRRIASLILCEYGIRALESISNVNQLLAISIVEQGGVEVIIRVMSRPEARPAVVIECGLFVWKLVLASSSARVSVPSASACVASLMDIVSRPKCSCDVLDAVFKDLAAFTFDKAGLSQQVLDNFKVLVPLLDSIGAVGSEAERWTEPFLDLLCNLSLPSRIATSAFSPADLNQFLVEIPALLLSVIEAHLDQERLVRGCMLALANVAASQAGCMTMADSVKGDIISAALYRHPDDVALQRAGCFLVARLGAVSERCNKELQYQVREELTLVPKYSCKSRGWSCTLHECSSED